MRYTISPLAIAETYRLIPPMCNISITAMVLSVVLLTTSSIVSAKTAHHLFHHQAFIPPIKIKRKEAINKHSMSLLLAKKSYDNDKKKVSQQEILLDLDRKFDYEGRIKSKIVDVSDDDDDVVTTTEEVEGEASHPHRCALLTILGMPNMGKSTLLNALLSDNLAITTSRPQTTRHAILGVMTTDYSQLCITDTPGLISMPSYKLQEGMMDVVKGAVRDADVFLVVTDVYSGYDKEENEDTGEEETVIDETMGIGEEMLSKLQSSHRPVIVCVNKVDLAVPKEDRIKRSDEENANWAYNNTPIQAIQTVARWRSVLPDAFAIIPTCAQNGSDDPGVEAIRSILLANDPNIDVGQAIRGLGRPVPGMFRENKMLISDGEAREILPIGPPLYHPDFFTDRTDRFCASELIRETLFLSMKKELPYCCEVRIETFDESKRYLNDDDNTKQKSMIRIEATILVERDSQKGIVVGKGGAKIKDVGVNARNKLQDFFGCKIYLDLRVKVDKNWRNNADQLKKYGYM